MKYIDKNKDLKDYTLIHESVVLKLDTKAKELLGYFFDALNFIYSEIEKNNNIQNINYFLLSLKPKIDSIIGAKNKEVIYHLLNIALAQWFKEDIGSAYLKIDKPSKILKNNKISLPFPYCSNVDFISPDIYEKHLYSYHDPYIKILKVKNIFIAQIAFYQAPLYEKKIQIKGNCEQPKYSQQKKKPKVELHNQGDKHHEDYRKYLSKYKKESTTTTPKNNNWHEKNNSPGLLNIEKTENLKNKDYKSKESSNYGFWKKYLERFKSTNNIDAEMVSEILEAFKEVDAKRSESNRKYLQEYYKNGNFGKFGLPQAKWRHGTYGINSKEPDFFSKIKD
ncbi:hypothetical protein [Acinetobacter sp. CAAS 2-6]|uniref:hypothetical protein n=1 Tax=Acinetobacter sp. CAAS 2-6 TaxID=3016358 RepID=UPI002DD6365E|nr:hypothetical protein [Acinetobacter sp. CAAS 2-6]